MKQKNRLMIFLSALFVCILTPILILCLQRRQSLRIACVGDSITYGAGISNISRNSYPAKLQKFLGSLYQVKNFGASGYTLQKSGDYPYWENENFQKSLDFAPNIVLLMLGTNDAKPQNWKDPEAFLSDYREIIRYYQELESSPQLYLMTPATVFPQNTDPELPDNDYDISAETVDLITELIRNLAQELNLPLIDIHQATSSHPEFFREDGVHPCAEGAEFIARQVYEAIKD